MPDDATDSMILPLLDTLFNIGFMRKALSGHLVHP